MPGRHASDDRRRFQRDLRRAGLLALGVLVVLVGAVLAARTLIGSSPDGDPAEGGSVAAAGPVETTGAPPATDAPTTTVPTTTTTAAPTTTTTEPPRPPVRPPSQIGVLVLNATSVGGLAGRFTDELADLGYRTVPPDNHPENLDTSLIWYVEGYDREAAILAEQVPDAEVVLFPGDAPRAPITVVLGAGHRE